MATSNADPRSGCSAISKTGKTRIGLRMQKDIDNDEPAGENVIRLVLGTGGGNPYLTIEHAGVGNIKKLNNLNWANVKKVNGVLVANIKKINGITAQ